MSDVDNTFFSELLLAHRDDDERLRDLYQGRLHQTLDKQAMVLLQDSVGTEIRDFIDWSAHIQGTPAIDCTRRIASDLYGIIPPPRGSAEKTPDSHIDVFVTEYSRPIPLGEQEPDNQYGNTWGYAVFYSEAGLIRSNQLPNSVWNTQYDRRTSKPQYNTTAVVRSTGLFIMLGKPNLAPLSRQKPDNELDLEGYLGLELVKDLTIQSPTVQERADLFAVSGSTPLNQQHAALDKALVVTPQADTEIITAEIRQVMQLIRDVHGS